MRTLPSARKNGTGSKAIGWFANLLLSMGILCLFYVIGTLVESRVVQTWASYAFSHPAASQPAVTVPVKGQWIGRLEIPRLNLSAMVREGDDDSTLRVAVGHIPGTALPGQSGMVALAGHRDTFFRGLRGIRKGDRIRFQSVAGTHEYSVETIQIVEPTETEVLQSDGGQSLSLITCFPFSYVGSAPQRFVVRARERKIDAGSSDEIRANSTKADF